MVNTRLVSSFYRLPYSAYEEVRAYAITDTNQRIVRVDLKKGEPVLDNGLMTDDGAEVIIPNGRTDFYNG